MFGRFATLTLAGFAAAAHAGPMLGADDAAIGAAHPAEISDWVGAATVSSSVEDLANVILGHEDVQTSAWSQLGNLIHARVTVAEMARLVSIPTKRSFANARLRNHVALQAMLNDAMTYDAIDLGEPGVLPTYSADAVIEPVNPAGTPDLFSDGLDPEPTRGLRSVTLLSMISF